MTLDDHISEVVEKAVEKALEKWLPLIATEFESTRRSAIKISKSIGTVDSNEASKLLGFSKSTLARWSMNGNGPIKPTRIGRTVRWRVADIEKLLSGQEMEQEAADLSNEVDKLKRELKQATKQRR